MFCSKCGTENPDGAKFCSKCGAELGVSVTPSGTAPSKTTWRPTTAGILSIIAGAMGIIGGIVAALFAAGIVQAGMYGWRESSPWLNATPELSDIIRVVFPLISGVAIFIAIFAITLAIVAIVGGVYALRRQKWGLALAGSICALLGPSSILGILAIIFVATGKNEFE